MKPSIALKRISLNYTNDIREILNIENRKTFPLQGMKREE